jgi:gentisate 1,2-dioxygenase
MVLSWRFFQTDPSQHQPIRGPKGPSGRFRPPQHNDLLPKHKDFCFQRRSRPKQIDDETKYQSDENQHQAQRRPILYAAPTGFNLRQGQVHYRGADVREALNGLRKEEDDPYEGIQMQFINPVTGGPVGTVLDYAAQLLRPGEETRPKRETCSTFMVVMDGCGYTEVGDHRFEWEINDIVIMPNFL